MLYYDVEECSNCGYVSFDISEELFEETCGGVVIEEEYQTCNDFQFVSDFAKKFYKMFIIEEKLYEYSNGNPPINPLRFAIWACDDVGDKENAIKLMEIAFPYLDKLIRMGDNAEAYTLIKIDFLRRCKMFREVKNYKNNYFDDLYFDNILKYQLYLAEQKDDKIHYLDEV